MVIDDLHTYFGRTPRVRSAARQFIQQNLGANDLMAVIHTAGPSDASQEFTGNKRLLLAAVDRTLGRKLNSATVTRTDEFNRQRDLGRETGGAVNDPAGSERYFNARHVAHGTQERGRLVLHRARPTEDDSVRQRRHRLRHQRFCQQPGRVD